MVLNTTSFLIRALVILVAASIHLTATAAGDPEKGKAHFQLCIACHGPSGEGNKVLNAPATAAQYSWYIARQLKNLKAGLRGSHPEDIYGAQMRPMALVLANDEAIEDVSAYIEQLPMATIEDTVVGDAEAGKKAFAPCLACHGEDGLGVPELNAPRLTGQNDWYLVRQLKNFHGGLRGTDKKDIFGTQMRHMSQLLLDETQINDVVAYINTLK